MAVDNTFMIRKIQTKEKLFAAYCGYTNMPFLICDPETFNDQVWIFDSEKLLQDFAKPHTQKKILLRGIELKNSDLLKFFSTLFLIGANEVVFVDDGGSHVLELESIVRRPDYSKLKPEQVPISNPNLALTGIYFMQEALRPVPNEEKPNLKELEEELSANMIKARYIIPLELTDGPGNLAEKLKNKEYKLPILKDKEGNIFQPAFTDVAEFEKFSKGKRLSAVGVPFANLSKLLTKDAKGYMLNPQGFHIMMQRQLLEALPKRFQ